MRQIVSVETRVLSTLFSGFLPETSTMQPEPCQSPTNSYRDLKKQQPLIFAKHYLSEFPSLPVKPEFDKYFKDSSERWDNLKLRPENGDLSSDELCVLNPEEELENQKKEKPKPVGRKRLSQYQVKVEELPIGGRRISNGKSEFTSVQIQYDIKNGGKTYHTFTILPKNRLGLKNERKLSSPDIIDLTEIPSKRNSKYNRPQSLTFPFQSNQDLQNPSEVLQEIRSEAEIFDRRNPFIDQNRPTTVESKNPSPQKSSNKKREITRTFCNGARAIVSYFSLDEDRTRNPKTRRPNPSPFTELNSRAPIGTVP